MTAGEPFVPYRRFQGALIPEGLLKFSGVCRGAVLLYGQLARYAGKNGLCFPGQARLAEDLRTTARTVQRWVRELVNAGLLARRRRGAGTRSNSYQFLWSDLLGRQLAFEFADPATPVQKPADSVENPVENEDIFLAPSRQKCRVSEPPILMCEEAQFLCSRREESQAVDSAVENGAENELVAIPVGASAPAEAEAEPNMAKRTAQNSGAERLKIAGRPGDTKTSPENAVSPERSQENGIPARRDAGRAACMSQNRHENGRPMQPIAELLAGRLNKMGEMQDKTPKTRDENAA